MMDPVILNELFHPYKEFDGENRKQMPLLIKEGRTPLSVAGLMQRRLDVLNSGVSKEVKDAWWENRFDTGDASAYDTQGNMKVVLDAQPLRELNAKSKLQDGALVIPYANVQGEEFTEEQKGQYTRRKCFTKGQSVKNPIWVALARGDKTLLQEYDTAVFARAKEFGHGAAMGIFPASSQDKETMRLWFLGYSILLSNAYGDNDLDDYDGHLVGVAQEGRSPSAQKGESLLAPELSEGKSRTEHSEVTRAQVARKTASSNGSIVAPTLEQVLALGREHVSKAGMNAFETEAKKLYK